MNQDLALRVLSEIMKWEDVRARAEFAWLRLMSRLKYDSYRDFVAAARFIECLADWLQQFEPSERETAYQFVRQTLVFIGPMEMNHLIEYTYPEVIKKRLLASVATKMNIPSYMVGAYSQSRKAYNTLLRRTLFLGLSDGARIDDFRRANVGIISNEQVVPMAQISDEKWESLLSKLRTDKDVEDQNARFAFIYLMDDFMGSGTTLLRKPKTSWEGKLCKFWDETKEISGTYFDQDCTLCVHHYIASHSASMTMPSRVNSAIAELGSNITIKKVELSFSTVLPNDLRLDAVRHKEFLELVRRYYDPSIETDSTRLGGSDVRLGFASCGLPLVLEHNTPNNSIALLWADTVGGENIHSMRPLFRRKQRHTS